MNKPSLRLLRASHGPLAAGGTCVADLGGGLDVCGLENGDVIIVERENGELISAVRASSYAKSSYGHCACVCSVVISRNNSSSVLLQNSQKKYFVTTSMDCQVIVWDSHHCVPLAQSVKWL